MRPTTWHRAAGAVVVVLAVGSTAPGSAIGLPDSATHQPALPAHQPTPPAHQLAHHAAGRTVVVAPGGDDRAAGTAAHPLATVATAVHRLAGGGTVLLRAGHYAQRVQLGAAVHDLTVTAYRGEHATLDGGTLRAPDGMSAMVTVDGSRRVTVSGLDIRGYDTVRAAAFPIGILIRGGATHVTVARNHVHAMGTYDGALGSFDSSAHGIAAYGNAPSRSISDLRIVGNEVDHLSLGASEAVVVNGNVDGWSITGNRVHDNNNIGIDAIGYEPTLAAPYRYTDRNRARNGVIADNTVVDTVSRGNPAYYEDGAWCNCADGVYVDGGTHIRVERNRLSGNDIGIEVAAENARGAADHVVVADNFVTGSAYTGIATGGYCNGAEACGGVQTGSSHDNVFVGNTLYGNNTLDDGSPELLVQYHTWGNTIRDNIIVATGSGNVVLGTVDGARREGSRPPDVVDDNLYWTTDGNPGTASFGSYGTTFEGFDHYRRATGLDRYSRFLDPRLLRPAAGDLHLRAGSPAIDSGAVLPPVVVGRFDVDRQARVVGRRMDVGADERQRR